jgi:hypothetical protein
MSLLHNLSYINVGFLLNEQSCELNAVAMSTIPAYNNVRD